MLTEIIPAVWRSRLYVAFAFAGVVLGGVQVGFASASAGQPTALTVALAVYAFIGTAFGFTAASNTPSEPKYDGPPDPTNPADLRVRSQDRVPYIDFDDEPPAH